jgi:pilus assembly protein CpaF
MASPDTEQIINDLRAEVLSHISMDREMTDDEVKDIIDRTVITNGKKYSLSLNLKQTIARDLFY